MAPETRGLTSGPCAQPRSRLPKERCCHYICLLKTPACQAGHQCPCCPSRCPQAGCDREVPHILQPRAFRPGVLSGHRPRGSSPSVPSPLRRARSLQRETPPQPQQLLTKFCRKMSPPPIIWGLSGGVQRSCPGTPGFLSPSLGATHDNPLGPSSANTRVFLK